MPRMSMKSRLGTLALVVAAPAWLGVGGPATAHASPSAPAVQQSATPQHAAIRLPVVPPVEAVDGCTGNSGVGAWHLDGELIGAHLRNPRVPLVVTVNDFGLRSQSLWHLRTTAGVDFAGATARDGVDWLLLDLAGYGRSTHPNGSALCLPLQADLVTQVIGDLQTGHYRVSGLRPRIGRVVLWGHAVGAAVAEQAAAKTHVAGLVLTSWSDQAPTAAAVEAAGRQYAGCGSGHDYSYFGATAAEFRRLYFAGASLPVQRAAFAARQPDPCGDVQSLPQTMAANNAADGAFTGPVLLAFGGEDAVITPQGREQQERSFASAQVTRLLLPRAGNALPLEPGHQRLAQVLEQWLSRRS